ncbi:hypothetical protein [Rhodopirellula bahusiensis]|nr:hypothetical protein [Rhodopirellula bahusiensis]
MNSRSRSAILGSVRLASGFFSMETSTQYHMQSSSKFLAVALGAAIFAIGTYHLATAADPNAPHPSNYLTSFTGKTVLVVLDLGADGIERTVLRDASLTGIGEKPFLGGVVTDKYPEFPVIMPGEKAYVALDRIVYVQVLDDPKVENGE